MRIVKNFNQNWLFVPKQAGPDLADDQFEKITLPHTNRLFARYYVDNANYQFVSTYRKHFRLPEEADGKRLFLDFDGVMLACTVYLNEKLLGVHKGGFTPFAFDITDQVQPGENVLTVYVDATENKDIPPYGNLVDYLTFGGIYRDVLLRMVEPCHIANAFVIATNVLTSPQLDCHIELAQWMPELTIEARLEDAQRCTVAQQVQEINADIVTVSFSDLDHVDLWTLDNPVLYTLKLVLALNGVPIDKKNIRFGFRSAEFDVDKGFVLNGKPLKLFGLNRHQTYPYIGAAAPARLQWMDAEILKYELGCNVVRASHYAQSPYFLDRCDEIGLLVMEEIAGWQYIGDANWQTLALQDLEAMIKRDRNHPSIILWGTRINESPDDDQLYTQTDALAHQLDPSRQTGGVRNFIESHFLEDVFTLNDFTEGIQTPLARPHLITEFGGHMFPAKTWDHEERRVEHALKHARKHSAQMGHPDVSGAIGWCAFDYHTHKEFGSGDRICYHGVMDIYRLPKMAAYFYRSQKSPAEEVVLHAATNWTMGDRSGGGTNPLVVFSNCETVEVLIGDISQGFYQPDTDHYPHLAHPPFVIRWPEPFNPWGMEFLDLTVRGYNNGELIAEHKVAADHIPDDLRIITNTTQLYADGADMARIGVQIVDKFGNVLPYQWRIVHLTLDGNADLIGENPLPLLGGQAACFVRARHEVGEITVSACTDELLPVSMKLQIVKEPDS